MTSSDKPSSESKGTILPRSWTRARIRDVVSPFDTIDPTKRPNIKFTYVDIGSIDNHVQEIREPKELLGRDAPSRARRQIKTGDVLFSTVRTYLKNIAIVPPELDGAVTSTGIAVLRPNEVDSRFLFNWVRSPDFLAKIGTAMDGTMYPAVSDKDVLDEFIPIPPLPEQRRLVAKLDSFLKYSQTAREELSRVPRLIERYKRAILGKAFCGDLTSDWRDLNPTVQPVSSAANKDPHKRKRRSGTAASSVNQLPNTWLSVSVDSVGEVILGRQRSPDNHTGPHMRPYVRAANITWNGWDLSDVKKMNFDERDFEKFKLHTGDVLINEGSGSADEVGKPAIWNGEIADCCFQNTLIAVRPHAVTSDYLYFVLLNAALSKAFVDETRGVNIHHIGRAGLAQFVIPLPPADEQLEIVRRLTAAFTKIAQTLAEATRATELLDRLDQATLAKAFRGELVAQDPKDEPVLISSEGIDADADKPTQLRRHPTKRSLPGIHAARTKERDAMAKRRTDVTSNHLTECLRALGGSADAKHLWQRSEMDIDEFYKQLRDEIKAGRIEEASSKERLKLTNAA